MSLQLDILFQFWANEFCSYSLMLLSGEATNTSFMSLWFNPTMVYHTPAKNTNHYITGVVNTKDNK